MNQIKEFFNDFPRNIKRGEKGYPLFVGFLSLLAVACVFAIVVFVPRLFSSNAVNAGLEDTSAYTSDPDLRYDYSLVEEPTVIAETLPSETETVTESTTKKAEAPVKVQKPVKNDPESIQKPKDDPGPPIVIPDTPAPPPITPEIPGNGDANASYRYFATQGLNGFQQLGSTKYYFENGNTKGSGIFTSGGLRYRINNYGAVSSKMGIDISEFNGVVNWNVAKNAGVEFAIIRCAYRGYGSDGNLKEDGLLVTNIRNAKAAGMPVGLYFFSQAVNAAEGAEEGRATVQYAQQYGVQLPLYIDTEASTHPQGNGRADHISKADRTAAVKAFCDTVRSYGYTPGIYASASWFTDKLNFSQISNNDIWVAHYTGANAPSFNSVWKTWQYSSKLEIPGLQTGIKTVDVNISTFDYVAGNDMSTLGKNNILLKTQSEVDVYMDAENAVSHAEQELSQQAYDSAADKVSRLMEARVKNTMLARLRAIEANLTTTPPSTESDTTAQ